jgi:hypothetical protein
MNFPTWKSASLPKKPGGKSKRILYQSFITGHFFSVFDKVWQKTGLNRGWIVFQCANLAAPNCFSTSKLSLNKK